ncbi:hypothetical protein B9Y82_04290 [Stenotrophomonas maltophilia]|nr:hypothetical protein B9Y82_04290 [Stenotrophomonas maltophilia]
MVMSMLSRQMRELVIQSLSCMVRGMGSGRLLHGWMVTSVFLAQAVSDAFGNYSKLRHLLPVAESAFTMGRGMQSCAWGTCS